MHSYLRSIGFSQINRKRDVDVLVDDVIHHFDQEIIVKSSEMQESVFAELRKEYGNGFGIALRGEYFEDGSFDPHYYYPYFLGSGVTTEERIEVERHADKFSFAGVCDEIKIGVTLIFFLQNMVEYCNYRKEHKNLKNSEINGPTILSGLSISGKILLPIQKDEYEIHQGESILRERNHLIEAAREGDEEAIENLTLEDMDTYSMISRRILNEDVLSIVSSYFMPYGIESDHYSILGEILDYELVGNKESREEVYRLTLNCNDLVFDLCINKQDLAGEPGIGRRFKGNIWMQGNVIMST